MVGKCSTTDLHHQGLFVVVEENIKSENLVGRVAQMVEHLPSKHEALS
jgi:hypothetical protein